MIDNDKRQFWKVRQMIILVVIAAIVLILGIFYLINSWKQYRQWKLATLIVIISLAGVIYGTINLPYWHQNSSFIASQSASASSLMSSSSLLSSSTSGNQSAKASYILGQLQKNFTKLGTVSYDSKAKTYTVTPSGDDITNALSALESDTSYADQIGWPNLTSNLQKTSQSIQNSIGNGYTLQLMSPNDNSKALLSVKDGHVTYNIVDSSSPSSSN